MAGQRAEQVGKRMVELCMERGARITRPDRTQTRGKVHCGAVHGTGGYAHGGSLTQEAGTCVAGSCAGRAGSLVPCNGKRVVRDGAEHGTDPHMYGGAVHATSGDAHGG